jgi:hypothetical protein
MASARILACGMPFLPSLCILFVVLLGMMAFQPGLLGICCFQIVLAHINLVAIAAGCRAFKHSLAYLLPSVWCANHSTPSILKVFRQYSMARAATAHQRRTTGSSAASQRLVEGMKRINEVLHLVTCRAVHCSSTPELSAARHGCLLCRIAQAQQPCCAHSCAAPVAT